MTAEKLSLISLRALSLGRALRSSVAVDFSSDAHFTWGDQTIRASLSTLPIKMWNRVDHLLWIDIDDAAYRAEFCADLHSAHGILLTRVGLLIDQTGTAILFAAYECDAADAARDLAAVNDLHFNTGRTSERDGDFYEALLSSFAVQKYTRATSAAPLDYVPRTADTARHARDRARFFDDVPWRACHFIGPADVVGRLPQQDQFDFDAPMPGRDWVRAQVTRVTDKNGIYTWQPDKTAAPLGFEDWVQVLYPVSLPLMSKAIYDSARTNALAYTSRFVEAHQTSAFEQEAQSFIASTRLRFAHYARLRSFLSSTQKVLHDVNVDYYQLADERDGMTLDFGTLSQIIDSNRAASSERFTRMATWIALIFTGLSFVSTVIAVVTFYLDPNAGEAGDKLAILLAGGSVGLCAVLALYILGRR